MIDGAVIDLADRCIRGGTIDEEQALALMRFDALSAEAAHIRWAAEAIARSASSNKGQIYAQIGVDSGPCPVNCAFCSLAQVNQPAADKDAEAGVCAGAAEVAGAAHNAGADADPTPDAGSDQNETDRELPIERIVEYARVFDRAGVHLITLMSTAAMPHRRYLDIVRAVRDAVSPDMPLMANTADFSAEQARMLKEAGVQAVYHADRLGEGVITPLEPARREQTIAHAREAGLALMTAVEPVTRTTSAADVVAAMRRVIDQRPYCSGVGVLTAIRRGSASSAVRDDASGNASAGTVRGSGTGAVDAGLAPISRARGAQLAAIMRLMAGESIPFGTGGGNVVWVDAGANPRGRDLPIDEGALRRDVARRRKELLGREWEVPDRPLRTWFG